MFVFWTLKTKYIDCRLKSLFHRTEVENTIAGNKNVKYKTVFHKKFQKVFSHFTQK